MELEIFIDNYLKRTARITLANTMGDILYHGLVKNLPEHLMEGTVERIEGLGNEDDIIIFVDRHLRKRRGVIE